MKADPSYTLSAESLSPRHRLLIWALNDHDVEPMTDWWETPLHQGAADAQDGQTDALVVLRQENYVRHGNTFVLKWLTAHPDQAWMKDENGWDALDWAVVHKHIEVVKHLLNHPDCPPLSTLMQRVLPVIEVMDKHWCNVLATDTMLADQWKKFGGIWSTQSWWDAIPWTADMLEKAHIPKPSNLGEVWENRLKNHQIQISVYDRLMPHLQETQINQDLMLEQFIMGLSDVSIDLKTAFKNLHEPSRLVLNRRGPSGKLESCSLLGVCLLELIRASDKNFNTLLRISSDVASLVPQMMGESPRLDLWPGFAPEPILAWLSYGRVLCLDQLGSRGLENETIPLTEWLIKGGPLLQNLANTKVGATKPFQKTFKHLMKDSFSKWIEDRLQATEATDELDATFAQLAIDPCLGPMLVEDANPWFHMDKTTRVYTLSPAAESFLENLPDRWSVLTHSWAYAKSSALGAWDRVGPGLCQKWLTQDNGGPSPQEMGVFSACSSINASVVSQVLALVRAHRLEEMPLGPPRTTSNPLSRRYRS